MLVLDEEVDIEGRACRGNRSNRLGEESIKINANFT